MRIVIFYFAFTLSASLFGQKPAEIVRANMALQQTAWNNGDISGFMDHYWKHDSLKFIGSRGVTYGWQRTLENYQKGYPDKAAMGELTFTLVEVTELSQAAVFVIGKWDLKKEKPAGGYFTLLWKKIKGKWVIVADHTS
jgi:ketosteroid isomerase-like protein